MIDEKQICHFSLSCLFLYEQIFGKQKNSQVLERTCEFFCIGWSWRESNPRPHKETIRFLHAYSSLQFSRYDKTWTTNHTLIL